MKIIKTKRYIRKHIKKIKFLDDLKILKKLKEWKAKKYIQRRNKDFKMYAEETLNLVKVSLEKEKILFWLDFGTLLGAIREKNFIAHDFDIDLGIRWNPSEIERIEEIFKKENIVKCKEFLLGEKVVEQTYKYKGVYFDIFYYFEDEENMWCYTFFSKDYNEEIFENNKVITVNGMEGFKCISPKRGLETIKFKGKNYWAPENPHEYLKINYGENYMTPIQEWNYVEDTKNQEEIDKHLSIKMIEYVN